ncbi:hypothetical protein, partial [Mesorhizobium sp.]|uniref:hypothetical protein n=1 Tax=Mesorhizobium sp. TaxID=1871066 RepID=UPI0025E7AB09
MARLARLLGWRSICERLRRPSSACRHLLPVNGAKDAIIDGFANRQRCRKCDKATAGHFSRLYSGEVPGRAMR